uniref:Uncharacterized protein n=1 Tax=Minutocellus polymorphus TaxID=265543 RepID=A0A7S0B271_9STRA|mmetsp:Transcript_9519/g.15809  ORF Transcript_9519/g.15809 Transcript_9519/m.15809 type:complete len:183 (+) Transcript_9519:146-694(+)
MQPSAATNRQWTMASGRAVGAAPHFAHTSAGAASGSTSGGIAAADRGVGGNWGVGGAAASASGVVMGIGGGGIGDGGVGGGLATVPPPAAPAMWTGRLVYQRGQRVGRVVRAQPRPGAVTGRPSLDHQSPGPVRHREDPRAADPPTSTAWTPTAPSSMPAPTRSSRWRCTTGRPFTIPRGGF